MKRTTVLYLEVADRLKEDIFSGKYPVGSMLPTESELEELFQVSKITIRKAIELLAMDEYVEKKSGKGTTVLSNRPYNRLSKAESFTQVLKKSDFDVEKKVLTVQEAPLSEPEWIEAFGETAWKVERLYLLDGQPYIYFTHLLPIEMQRFTKEQYEQESLYRLLTKQKVAIERFEDDFSAVFLTEEEKSILQTEEAIAVKRIRRSRDAIGHIVEYSTAIYNTNLHPYHAEYET